MPTRSTIAPAALLLTALAVGLLAPPAHAQPGGATGHGGPADASAEAGGLENHRQLTFGDRFYKAGEAYFSPDATRIIFQAIETPAPGEEPLEYYGMYVGRVRRDANGSIAGLQDIVRLSPEGSANTCGWFPPDDDSVVLFGSTIVPPTATAPPGYDRRTGRYKWMFPPEMRIVRCDLRARAGSPSSLETIAGDGPAYCAEGAVSPDGRHLVYCSLESGDGDLFIKDLESGRTARVVAHPGYDGGPFFSPDGKRICYRSDRHGNHRLQLFVADLSFDASGAVTGIEREYQLTDNDHVNWAPFWHPGGRHLVYATSEVGHRNYEVFIIDADPGNASGSSGSIKYGTRKRRVTHTDRADVLPVFSPDGRTMLWTSQRGEDGRSQLWIADFVMELDPAPEGGGYDPSRHRGAATKEGGRGR
jgi:hypothetical protein